MEKRRVEFEDTLKQIQADENIKFDLRSEVIAEKNRLFSLSIDVSHLELFKISGVWRLILCSCLQGLNL